jgi:hypothetical protein
MNRAVGFGGSPPSHKDTKSHEELRELVDRIDKIGNIRD